MARFRSRKRRIIRRRRRASRRRSVVKRIGCINKLTRGGFRL